MLGMNKKKDDDRPKVVEAGIENKLSLIFNQLDKSLRSALGVSPYGFTNQDWAPILERMAKMPIYGLKETQEIIRNVAFSRSFTYQDGDSEQSKRDSHLSESWELSEYGKARAISLFTLSRLMRKE